MILVVVALLTLAQTQAEAGLNPEGQWRLTAHQSVGELKISVEKNGSIKGSLFNESLEGSFDPDTRRIRFRRMIPAEGGKQQAVQVFIGELRKDDNPGSPRLMSGTFRSVCGGDWGQDGVDYPWEARALTGTFLAEDLKELEGRWNVIDSQFANGPYEIKEDSNPLVIPGAVLEIRGNQVFHVDKLVATLANDLHMPGPMPEMRPNRKPLMIVLTDGRAYLVAYDGRSREHLEIVFPHTTGNVGRAHFIYWERSQAKVDSAEVK